MARIVSAGAGGIVKGGTPLGDLRILHVTEAYGGGVAAVIAQYMSWPGASHCLLARVRRADIHPSDIVGVSGNAAESFSGFVNKWLRARTEHYDVVHAHSSLAGLITRVFPHPSARLVYTPHSAAFAGHRRALVRLGSAWFEKLALSRTDALGAVSSHEGVLFRALGMPSDRIEVVPHAFVAMKSRVATSVKAPIFVSVGRLCYQKRPEMLPLIKSVWERRGLPPARWLWVGDGDDRRRRLLEGSGIRVTGWLSNVAAKEMTASSTTYLHLARYEGLPVAALEAMASRTPVVGFKIPGLDDIASIAKVQSVEEMVQVMAALCDPSFRGRQVNRQDVELAHRFSPDRQFEALGRLYSR